MYLPANDTIDQLCEQYPPDNEFSFMLNSKIFIGSVLVSAGAWASHNSHLLGNSKWPAIIGGVAGASALASGYFAIKARTRDRRKAEPDGYAYQAYMGFTKEPRKNEKSDINRVYPVDTAEQLDAHKGSIIIMNGVHAKNIGCQEYTIPGDADIPDDYRTDVKFMIDLQGKDIECHCNTVGYMGTAFEEYDNNKIFLCGTYNDILKISYIAPAFKKGDTHHIWQVE